MKKHLLFTVGGLFPQVMALALLASNLQATPALAQGPGPDSNDPAVTGRIVGRVVDVNSAHPLSGVQVLLLGSQQGTLTDLNGRYLILNVPAGSHDLVAEMIGYARKTVTNVVVDAGATVALDVALETEAIELDGITAVRQILVSLMTEQPDRIHAALEYVRIAQQLGRIGDLATNISEDVVFFVEDRTIKHNAEAREVAADVRPPR